jgi:hypothetical protein
MTTPLEKYLHDLQEIRSSGASVKETSYYPALRNLLSEIGHTLKPKVICVMNLADQGAGLPDGGLFSEKQFDKRAKELKEGQLPSRGAIEVKGAKDDAWVTAESEQVTRYWKKYRQVLVTNYREFVLVGQDNEGKPVRLEKYSLAGSAPAFWNLARHPRTAAKNQSERFTDFLKRVMLHAAPLATPEALAWFLASYAREALARIERPQVPALEAVRTALEDALGLKFEGEKGEHFFRSSLVQTLFYGVFSAWVLWDKQHPRTDKKARFGWNDTAGLLRVPIIRKLFHEVAEPGQLKELHLTEVLEWATTVLNRVDRAAFFERFEEGHAVQYFYEPFLEAFDPELRKQLGVWYTPPEIVEYMVARVDTVLREELGVADGLADKQVYVLDPCCGTGSYLVEVLKRIHATLEKKGKDALTAADLKEAAQKRVFGFEILPAPFVVSHLQLGLLLQNLGAPLGSKKEDRVGVYLTNALTGWEPPKEPKTKFLFPELKEEHDAAEKVKRETPILVVLGNPPYNAFAGVSPTEEQRLVEPYKEGLVKEWGIKKFNLDDLYVRFFRLAERRIVENERPGRGVLCFISNFSYLGDPSFVVLRKRLLKGFDKLWFDCMNGDSRETGKLTPDRKPDPSVFSTEYNREGIRVGTTIGLLVRRNTTMKQPKTRFRHFWGVNKRRDLLQTLESETIDQLYQIAEPSESNRFSFRPSNIAKTYLRWPKVIDFSLIHPFNGPIERRGNSLIVFESDGDNLKLVEDYLDAAKSDEEISTLAPRFMKSSGEFHAHEARTLLKGKVKFSASKISRYPFKPFDVRLAYLDADIQPLFSRPSPELLEQREIEGNYFLLTRDTADKEPEGPPFFYSRIICDYDCISGHARHFPMRIKAETLRKDTSGQKALLSGRRVFNNLAKSSLAYLQSLGFKRPAESNEVSDVVWRHVLAIGYAPCYLGENLDGLRQDWPRVPLPASKELLEKSAELGRKVAGLLDTEAPVKGVTEGEIREELKLIGVATRAGERAGKMPALQEDDLDLAVKVGWGHAGKGGVTMPGRGKLVEREYRAAEHKAIAEGAKALGLSEKDALAHLGEKTCDVYLNDVAYWANVPQKIWEYTIGGYQVMKKWLSYREEKLLGRALKREEVRYVQEMARRIAAILLLEPALDANYQAVKENTFPWDSLKS